jgi:hypothetical protein
MSEHLPSSRSGLATRPIAATFEEFEREVLLLATDIGAAPGDVRCGPTATVAARARICEDAQTRLRHGADDLLSLLLELKRWCLALSIAGDGERGAGKAPGLMDTLLAAAAANPCVYWMPPAAIPTTRPVVLVRLTALAATGRRAVLRAIWEHEIAVAQAQGVEEERGSLYEPLLQSFDGHGPQG